MRALSPSIKRTFCLLLLLHGIARGAQAGDVIETVAGNWTGGPAAASPVGSPSSVAVTGSGTIYLASPSLRRVFRIRDGQLTVVAGNGAQAPFVDGAPGTSSAIVPTGVATYPDGDVLIADSEVAHSIRRLNPVTGIMTHVAGQNHAGYAGDGGFAASATLNTPQGVASDSSGNIYIADWGITGSPSTYPRAPSRRSRALARPATRVMGGRQRRELQLAERRRHRHRRRHLRGR